MLKQRGFAFLELVTVVAIIGVLAATAVPLYRTYQQRTYGHEAVLMAKQIMEAQMMYFLEHNKFWPENNESIFIGHTTDSADPNINLMKNALNIAIPVGHYLDYTMYSEEGLAIVNIASHGGFALFQRDGSNPDQFQVQVDRTGMVKYLLLD